MTSGLQEVLSARPRILAATLTVLLLLVDGLLARWTGWPTGWSLGERQPGPAPLTGMLSGMQLLSLLLVSGLVAAYLRPLAARLPLTLWALLEVLTVAGGLPGGGAALLSPGPALLAALHLLALLSLVLGVGISLLRVRRLMGPQAQGRARDLLTGLDGREGFMQQLGRGTRQPGMLLLADVNGLKRINDLHGHAAGDQQILRVVQALRETLPGTALLARWGGDELIALLPGSGPDEAQHLAGRALALATARGTPEQAAPCSSAPFSFGLAPLESPSALERSLALADHALYLQKGAGGSSPEDDYGLIEFSRRLERLETPEDVLREGLHLSRQLLQMDVASYAEVTAGGKTAERLVAGEAGAFGGQFTPLYVDKAPGVRFDLLDPGPPRRLSGMGDQVFRLRQTVVSVDYPSDPLSGELWRAAGVKSMLVTAVEQGGVVVGLLSLVSVSGWKALPLRAQRVIELAALRLGHALELRVAISELRRGLEGGLLGLGVALEARDLETRGHTLRVVQGSAQLGRALGLGGAALDELQQGAYLHDIGKLVIPDRILLKPGALDPEEWAVMQTHAAAGAEIAAHIPQLAAGVLDVISHHHERWDGSGYPRGLVGTAIPLAARVFAVCDVYDALTSVRPYKRAWDEGSALAEIEAQSGRQFDPQVVQCFLSLKRRERTEAAAT